MNSSSIYYHSCDYQLIGDCDSCLEDYVGNTWSMLDDEETTCCTPTPYVKGKKILYSVMDRRECPKTVLSVAMDWMPYGLGLIGAVALGCCGYGIYRWIRKCVSGARNETGNSGGLRPSAAVLDEMEMVEMRWNPRRDIPGSSGRGETHLEEYEKRATMIFESPSRSGDTMDVNVDVEEQLEVTSEESNDYVELDELY